MTAIWRKHLIICLFLGLLAVPIYFLDLASTGGGGNWITLDFRGLVFWTYIALVVIDVVLSSIAVLSFPNSGALLIHFWSMLLSVVLLIAGFVFYGKLLRAQAVSSRQRTLMEKSLNR
jgi:predicted membrane channel-forming protein YqfA (hemolysin III family)